MPSRNASEYSGRTRDEYSDEEADDSKQTHYPSADQKLAWIETDTTANFIERIRGLDSNLAHSIDLRMDITMEPRARMEAVIDGFKSTQFGDVSDDIDSVTEVTQAIFKPIYEHMGYGSEKSANRQEWTLDERLGRVELLSRQYLFESSLRDSNQDPDGRNRYSAQMEQAVYETLLHPTEKDEEYTDRLFNWLKENMEPFGENSVQEVVEHKMKGTDEVYQEYTNTAFRPEGSLSTIAAAHRQLGENIWETLEQNDPDSFKKILDQFPERDTTLALEIRENTGFTNIPPEERPDFTQGLTTLAQKEEFVSQMNNIAENFSTSEYIPNPDLRNALENQVNELNLSLKDIQESPTQGTDPSEPFLYYFREEVEALKYITRPRDPEFWKILDHPDEATQDTLIAKVIEDKTQDPLESIKAIRDQHNRPREAALAAHSAMAHVCRMNIKSDLIDQDLTSYREHLEDMEERSQHFIQAILDDTGFIKTQGYEEPKFPQWADQAGSYLAAVNDKIQELNLAEEIETDHYKALMYMLDRYNQTTHRVITIDISEQSEEYRNITTERGDTIRGIRILMRPQE